MVLVKTLIKSLQNPNSSTNDQHLKENLITLFKFQRTLSHSAKDAVSSLLQFANEMLTNHRLLKKKNQKNLSEHERRHRPSFEHLL